MSKKSKGLNAERELVHKFWDNGFVCNRIAGSGSIKYPSPDLIAGNTLRKIAMECKATAGTKQYLKKKEISELKQYCKLFGAEPWIGVRFDNLSWYFLTLEDLQETERENFVVPIQLAKRKGLLFEEMLGNF